MAKNLTAQEIAEKHARNLKNSVQDIRRGVERLTENPMEKAAGQEDKMRQNLLKSIDSGKWKAGLMRVSLEEWKEAVLTKGIDRIAVGIDAALPAQVEFYGQLIEHQNRLSAKINNMPDLTLEDSIARMTAQVRGMADFVRR